VALADRLGTAPVVYLLLNFCTRRALLRVTGVLDIPAQCEFRRRLRDAVKAGCLQLDVDCDDVRYIPAASLHDLALARAELARHGGSLVVVKASEAFTAMARAAGRVDLLPEPPPESSPEEVAARVTELVEMARRIGRADRRPSFAVVPGRRRSTPDTSDASAGADTSHSPR
jgi:anti-anti-sigma factor